MPRPPPAPRVPLSSSDKKFYDTNLIGTRQYPVSVPMPMSAPVPDAGCHAPRTGLEADLQQLVLRPAPAQLPRPARTRARAEHRQARGRASVCGYLAGLEYLHIYI